MGYCIHLIKSEFYIASGCKEAALQALKNLCERETNAGLATPRFSFVGDFMKAQTLWDALHAWRWPPDLDDEENVIALDFIGEKSGNEDVLFGALAPFVRDGSNIQMVGEDGKIWRWLFRVGKVVYQQGEVVFADGADDL